MSFLLFAYVLYIKYIVGHYLSEGGWDFEEPGLVEGISAYSRGVGTRKSIRFLPN